jgi:cation:H+ antiporter
VAAYRKNSDIAIGNIVGSNIFNIFFILSVSAFIHPLPYALNFNFDTTVLIGGTMLLLFFAYTGKKAIIDRWEGIVFVSAYIGYTAYLIMS